MNPKSTKRQKEQARLQKRLDKEAEREKRKRDREAGIVPDWMKEPPPEGETRVDGGQPPATGPTE